MLAEMKSHRGWIRNVLAGRFAASRILLTMAVFALLAAPLRAQLYSGTITGVVSDPTGAVIPGAKVTLTDITKGYAFSATSDAVGRYILRNIPPSTYQLRVEATGFKSYTRTGIVLDVNQNATADVSMELGTTTQTVQVSGAAPLMATQDATTGQNVNRTYINDLPLVGRGVFDLAFLSPGVNPSPGLAFGNSDGVANNFTSNGGRNATSDILIDGVSSTDFEQNSAIQVPLYTPSVDAVQEFKVQQNNFSAEIGFSGNTVLNVVMRSGTNQIHGSLYEFLRNQALNANNWFNNQAGIDLPARRYNQFGGTVGGPIVIPHLYNGKDKTFFFFDYQATRDHSANSFHAGVPSAAERLGNFGELCAYAGGTFDGSGACSADAQLWDPYSGVYDPDNGGPDRSAMIPFNNMATYQSAGAPALNGTPYQIPAVPGNVIDPTSMKMMSFYPLPNLGTPAVVDAVGNVITPASANYDPYNNWAGAGVSISNGDQYDIKIDHRFSDRNLLSARYSQGWSNGHGSTCFNNPLDPCNGGPGAGNIHAVALNDTWTLNPTTVLSLGYGYARNFYFGQGPGPDFPNFNPVTDLGLPSYITASGSPVSPDVYVYGGYQVGGCCGSLGYQGWAIIRSSQETHDLLGSLDKIAGRHEIKVGGEYRMHRISFGQPGAPAGIMTFDFNSTSQYPWWGGGDAMASFLTGVGGPGQWGEYEVPLYIATQSTQYGTFIQDNWRVTDKLTVNLGLRYDMDLPRTERHDRLEWFDPHAALPFTVPGMNVTGTEMFAGVNGNPRTVVNSYYKELAPRVGIAYRFWKNTVFRAGYGIFYNPSAWAAAGTGPGGGDGFTGLTNWTTTYQNDNATPFGRMSNPFPYGVSLPTGSSLGPYTQLGLGASAPLRSDNAPSYTQTWSAGFQHELPAGVLLDLNYVGTKGTHLYFNGAGDVNHLGPGIEHASSDDITALQTFVPNPFYGLITDPNSSLSQPTVPQSQLDLPYPQFTGVNILFPPRGNSIYHALQLRVQKNLSRGLQFVGNYTWSKTISDSDVSSYTTWLGGSTGIQDPNNLKLERSVSQYSVPQVFTFGYVYELPFGRGKSIGSKWNPVVNAVLGGWKTAGLWRFDTGQPVAISLSGGGSPLPSYPGQRPNLTAALQRNTGSDWRTQYFTNPDVVQVPAPYTLGTAPRTLPNVYMPGAKTAGLSLLKEFSMGAIREGMRMEFRAETFNAFNHPQFGCLNGSVPGGFVGSDTTTYEGFGKLNCQANSPRELQLGLKLYF